MAVGLAIAGSALFAGEAAMAEYPKKTQRTLRTDAELQQARRNIEAYPDAAGLRDGIAKAADKWLEWPDERLAGLITPPEVPRAFNISFSGCPVHGLEAFKTGNYSFSIDLNRPFKVKCPVGGEEYPSNDFAAFLATGMKDRSILTGPYPDDGWGWKKPGEDKKYWFAAYYNHWAYMNHIIPATLQLSRAYLLTGDARYAHKAIILLDRIADVYPRMDHNKQSRYATEFAPSYTGKIVNLIWETGVGRNLCEAYDNIFDAIDRDEAAQKFLGKSGPQIRANIEKNLVREVIDCVYNGRIRGNFGMHQDTLLVAALVAQGGDEKQVADYLLNNTSGDFATEGYNYAIANYFTREGLSCREVAPGYCAIWPEELVSIADRMKRLGTNLFAHEKVRRIMLALDRLVVLDKFTPAIGDSSGVTGGAVRVPARMARIGYREYGGEDFAEIVRRGGEGPAFETFEDLFEGPVAVPAAKGKRAEPASDLLDNYGLALLRSERQPLAWSLFYGNSPGHGHVDKLNIELFALDHKLLPDLGYPQFAADDPEPPAWSRNTVSHNTVVVNAKQQTTVEAGRVRKFAASPTVQLVEIDAPAAYRGEVSVYRRLLASVDGRGGSYGVDIFRVVGGKQHDYSLHGPDGGLSVSGISLSEPQISGTLAGPDVPYRFLYDDPKFAKEGATSGYYGYHGSGFSFLKNVQRAKVAAPWFADWRLRDDPAAHVRVTWLPQAEQEEFVCDGYPPLRPGNPEMLKYVFSRREGPEPLASTFVALIEPYRDAPFVESVRSMTQGSGEDAVALEVKTADGADYIAAKGAKRSLSVEGLRSSADFGLVSVDEKSGLSRAVVIGAGEVMMGGAGVRAVGQVKGRVIAVDYAKREVRAALVKGSAAVPEALVGWVVRFANEKHVSAFFVSAARGRGGEIVLTLKEDPEAGLALVSKVDEKAGTIEAKTVLPMGGLRRYDGATLADERGRPAYRVVETDGSGAKIKVSRIRGAGSAKLADLDGDGRALGRLYDVGPGDEVEIAAVVHVERAGRNSYRVKANGPFELVLPVKASGRLPGARWRADGKEMRSVAVRRAAGSCRIAVGASALDCGTGRLWIDWR